MSNDISKYRVWDTKDKTYLDPNYYEEFAITSDGVIHVGLTVDNGICDEFQVIPPKQLIVEHCTGLKDKNGKLIYAEDVVFDISIKAIVRWYSDRYLLKYDNGSLETLASRLDKLEIIGNIHDEQFHEVTKMVENRECAK